MKALLFGPSGSGKTYISRALRCQGINAFDDGDIKGLSSWYDKHGQKIAGPQTAGEALDNQYSFLWSKRFLAKFLQPFKEVYIFGGSGNIFDMLDLFDQVYFLKINPLVQKQRILKASDRNRQMDINEEGVMIWGEWLEQEARKRHIPFIDAELDPTQIYSVISQR
jgi:hypothetical protein